MFYSGLLFKFSILSDCLIFLPLGHIFVQQPSHPSFLALPRLDQCMTNVYTKCQAPEVSRNEIRPSLVCAAPCDNKWYRVQVITLSILLLINYVNVYKRHFSMYACSNVIKSLQTCTKFESCAFIRLCRTMLWQISVMSNTWTTAVTRPSKPKT